MLGVLVFLYNWHMYLVKVDLVCSEYLSVTQEQAYPVRVNFSTTLKIIEIIRNTENSFHFVLNGKHRIIVALLALLLVWIILTNTHTQPRNTVPGLVNGGLGNLAF